MPHKRPYSRFTILFLILFLLFVLKSDGLPKLAALDQRGATQQQTTDVAALIAESERVGAVRVIVGFNAPFTPEGYLRDSGAVQTQRAVIP